MFFKKISQIKICKAEINYKKLNPKNWEKLSFKKIIKHFAFLIIFLAALVIIRDEYKYQFEEYSQDSEVKVGEDDVINNEKKCNVQGVELHGELVTYIEPEGVDEDGNITVDKTSSEGVTYLINQANNDDSIKAIILEVDSYGGSAVAGEEINQAVLNSKKPVIASVRSAATSAAYWSIVNADMIFASEMSDIGSIGVTMSYLDKTKKNEKEGLTYNSLSIGKFKDYGDPDKMVTKEERSLMIRDMMVTYDVFIKSVAAGRKLELNKVKGLADGSSMPGQMALNNGLIDRIGSIYDVNEYISGIIKEDVDICW